MATEYTEASMGSSPGAVSAELKDGPNGAAHRRCRIEPVQLEGC